MPNICMPAGLPQQPNRQKGHRTRALPECHAFQVFPRRAARAHPPGGHVRRTGDYLIASGIRSSWSEDKIFFFCADGVSWAQLPVLSDDESAACAAITGGLECGAGALPRGGAACASLTCICLTPHATPTAGDIAHVLQGELREEHLLVYMVQQIESDAAVAPTGALVLHPSGGAVPTTRCLDPCVHAA